MNLNEFLRTNIVDHKKKYTHCGDNNDRFEFYQISGKNIEPFWDLYCEKLKNDGDRFELFIKEIPLQYMPVIIDINLEATDKNYTFLQELKTIIEAYQNVLREIVDEIDDDSLTCVLFQKELTYRDKDGGELWFFNFRLHFPKIFLNENAMKNILLRGKSIIKDKNLFINIGYDDSSKCISDSLGYLTVYGCQRDNVYCLRYDISHIFDSNCNEISLQDAFQNYKIFDNNGRQIDINDKIQYYLPRILSIIPYGRATKELKSNIPTIMSQETKIESKSNEKTYTQSRSFGLTFYSKQTPSFENSGENQFFYSCDVCEGNKKYGSISNDSDFFPLYEKIPDNKKNFYEVIRTERPRFEYYDIEFYRDNFEIPFTMLKPENFFNYFISVRNSVLRSFDIDPERYPAEWFISDSSKLKDGKFKVSYHIVNRKMIFNNHQETLAWAEAFSKYIKKHPNDKLGKIGKESNVPDLSVYSSNRLMRILGSSKFGETRPLKKAEWHLKSSNAPFRKFLISNVKESDLKDASNLVFGRVPEIAIQMAEIKAEKERAIQASRDARRSKTENEEDNSLFYRMFDSLNEGRFEEYASCIRLIWLACKLDLSRDQIQQLSSKASNYSEDWTDSTINQFDDVKCTLTEGTLHEFLMQDNKERYDELVPKSKRFKHKTIPLDPISNPDESIELNNIGSYIPRFEKKKCIAIRSNMMTFKTQNMKELFTDDNVSVLCVSFRKTLDEAYIKTFEKFGFELYSNLQKIQGKLMAKRLVVQIDSLHLVQGQFDYLICDEIVSTIKHLVDFVREKSYVFEALKNYIRNCNRVLVCDALLNDSIITFFRRLRNDEVYVIDNQFKSFQNRSYKIIEAEKSSVVILSIIEKLSQGLKIAVPTNSKKFADKLYATVSNGYDNFFKVGLMTIDTDVIPVEQWSQYDLLIYTPKVVAGNSFDEVYFDEVIAFGCNKSCDANYFSQMLFRVRNIKKSEMTLYIKSRPSFLPVLSKPLHKFIKRQDDPVYKTGLTIDNYNQTIVKNDYYDLYANCLKIKHQSQNNFIGMLKGILNHHGLTENDTEENGIEEEEKTKEQLKSEEAFIDSCYEAFNLEIANEVVSASDIDSSTYESLKRKYDLNLTERRQVQKHIFQTTFNRPLLTPELFLELNDCRKQFKNAEELYQNKDDVENYINNSIQTFGEAKPWLETIDRLTSNNVVARYCKLFHALKIYKAYGFDGPFDTKTINELPYEKLQEFVVENFKKIETSFGSAVNKKKLKDFQDLDINQPKHREKLSRYLNDKLSSVLGKCGKIILKNKRKGFEKYGINGIQKYYEDLGVEFFTKEKRLERIIIKRECEVETLESFL